MPSGGDSHTPEVLNSSAATRPEKKCREFAAADSTFRTILFANRRVDPTYVTNRLAGTEDRPDHSLQPRSSFHVFMGQHPTLPHIEAGLKEACPECACVSPLLVPLRNEREQFVDQTVVGLA